MGSGVRGRVRIRDRNRVRDRDSARARVVGMGRGRVKVRDRVKNRVRQIERQTDRQTDRHIYDVPVPKPTSASLANQEDLLNASITVRLGATSGGSRIVVIVVSIVLYVIFYICWVLVGRGWAVNLEAWTEALSLFVSACAPIP
jgi:hypothetical protein